MWGVDSAARHSSHEPSKCLRKRHYDSENDSFIGNTYDVEHSTKEDKRCTAGHLLNAFSGHRPSKHLRKRHYDSECALMNIGGTQGVGYCRSLVASSATDMPCEELLLELDRLWDMPREKSWI